MITPPDPTKVLNYTDEHLDKIYDIKFAEGKDINKDGTVFAAYHLAVNSHLAVDNAYMKLRLQYPKAKYILSHTQSLECQGTLMKNSAMMVK